MSIAFGAPIGNDPSGCTMRTGLTVMVAALFSCGASPANLRAMHQAVYQTHYANVWNAVTAEMHDRFHDDGIWVEDVTKGVIISKWKAIPSSVTQEEGGESTGPIAVSNRGAVRHSVASLAGDMLQLRVRVEQKGPPWRITIEGEGAHRSANASMLRPYRRGASDEPAWVQGRIDSVREAIFNRLASYAVPPRSEQIDVDPPDISTRNMPSPQLP
jgi:hypothetical protein